jgi:hypothetical protein
MLIPAAGLLGLPAKLEDQDLSRAETSTASCGDWKARRVSRGAYAVACSNRGRATPFRTLEERDVFPLNSVAQRLSRGAEPRELPRGSCLEKIAYANFVRAVETPGAPIAHSWGVEGYRTHIQDAPTDQRSKSGLPSPLPAAH